MTKLERFVPDLKRLIELSKQPYLGEGNRDIAWGSKDSLRQAERDLPFGEKMRIVASMRQSTFRLARRGAKSPSQT